MSENLPMIDKDHPNIFNGIEVSYGIAPILNTLANLSRDSIRKVWNLYLINVETLIRDRKDKVIDHNKIARQTLLDCTVLSQYIAAYNRTVIKSNKDSNPMVVFYLPYYNNIPKLYLKDKLPKGTEDRWKIRSIIEDILKVEQYQEHVDDTDIVFSIVGKDGGWPHKVLIRDLNSILERLVFRKVLMVSHVPADFHLYRFFNDFTILESYTGALKEHKQLGKKVFKNEALPFNKYTHLLLGDKWYMKSLIKPKDKSKIIERATREHWSILPDKQVLSNIIDTHVVMTDMLIKPDI